MKSRVRGIILVLVIVAAGLLIGNFFSKQKEPMKQRSTPARTRSIQVLEVKNRDIQVPIPVSGLLEAFDRVDLFAEVSGVLRLTPKRFIEGQSFAKGEVLIRVDDTVYLNNLLAQRSELLNQLTILLPDLSIDFPDSAAKWSEYLKTIRIEEGIPTLPPAQNEKERYYIAARNIYTSYYRIKSMEATHAKYTLSAPFKGVVTEAMIKPGTLVRAGQRLGEFTSTELMELRSPVPIFLMNHIPLGEKIWLSAGDIPGKFQGRIDRLNRVIDRSTMTITVFVQMKDPKLKPGMYMTGEMLSRPIENVMMIERDLLMEGERIYRVDDENRLTLQPVEVLGDAGDKIIVSGLDEGMRILGEVWKEAREGRRIPAVSSGKSAAGPETEGDIR